MEIDDESTEKLKKLITRSDDERIATCKIANQLKGGVKSEDEKKLVLSKYYEQNWYKKLVDDGKKIVKEINQTRVQGFTSRHKLGLRVLNDEEHYGGWNARGNGKFIEKLAKDIEIGESTLRQCVRFAKKFPDIEDFLGTYKVEEQSEYHWTYFVENDLFNSKKRSSNDPNHEPEFKVRITLPEDIAKETVSILNDIDQNRDRLTYYFTGKDIPEESKGFIKPPEDVHDYCRQAIMLLNKLYQDALNNNTIKFYGLSIENLKKDLVCI